MEKVKINWNKVLNNLVAGISIIFVALFLGLCFIVPPMRVSALTKADIKGEYNIYFVSAKTRVRTATGLNKVILYEKQGNKPNAPSFSRYQYDYEQVESDKLYYGKNGSNLSSGNTNTNLIFENGENSMGDATIFEQFGKTEGDTYSRNYDFIPYGVNYFKNEDGNLEEIFYDEIDEGDYVLIDNYTNFPVGKKKVNVENFYLAMGTPYIDEKTTTPLNQLRVQGVLYSGGETHYLSLNETEQAEIEGGKNAIYWSQYFDLNNLTATETIDQNSKTYSVENTQGRYEFTFSFIRYKYENGTYTPVTDAEETFVYSFYLLDSADYSQYPEVVGAEALEYTENGLPNQYLYNFTKANPYIKYDPSKYNISYTRTNNRSVNNVNQHIVSTYTETTYTETGSDVSGRIFPLGIITFRDINANDRIVKQVFILTHYNDSQDVVEYLYLSRMNPTSANLNVSTYDNFKNYLEDGTLQFEYKLTSILKLDNSDGSIDNYTLTTYKTTDYAKFEFGTDKSSDGFYDKGNSTVVNLLYNRNSKQYNTANYVASFSDITESSKTYTKDDLTKTIYLDTTTLKDVDKSNLHGSEGSYTLKENTQTSYKLVTDNGSTYLEKTYLLSSYSNELDAKKNLKTIQIQLDVSRDSSENDFTVVDSVHNITIKYKVTEGQVSDVKFSLENKIAVTCTGYTDQKVLKEIINMVFNKKIPLKYDYSYNLVLDELGIYDIEYSYVVESDNKFVINSTESPTTNFNYSNSTNYTIPQNFSVKVSTKAEDKTETSTESQQHLYATFSAPIVDRVAKLMGEEYTYNEDENKIISKSNTTYDLNVENNNFRIDDRQYTVIFSVSQVSNVNYLNLKILLTKSNVKVTTTKTTETKPLSNLPNYLKNITTTIEYDFEDAQLIESPSDENWKDLKYIIETINSNKKFTVSTRETVGAEQGADILHIFGSITYFNKPAEYSDSNYTKLQQIDARLNLNFVSDITSIYLNKNTSSKNYLDSANEINNFRSTVFTNINSLYEDKTLNKDNIIVTDKIPILWNNFSTLLFNSNKIAMSQMRRYTSYSVNDDNSITFDKNKYEVSSYSKDMYVQFDGLYQIIIFYNYNFSNLTTSVSNRIYYQMFTFIIDNRAPNLTVEVDQVNKGQTVVDKQGNPIYVELGHNKYTNRNVRLTWEVPSYFKNDIYLEINKTYFTTTNTTYNFNALYQQSKISTLTGSQAYVNAITTMSIVEKEINSKTRSFYEVLIQIKNPTETPQYRLDGNYRVTMHYNSGGKSTFSQEFIIDTLDIAGLNIQPISRNNDGTYNITDNENFSFGNSQIVNHDFTFRFNRKESGASIYVSYDKINLTNFEDFDQIVNAANGAFGITTKYAVNGDKVSTGTKYVYNYDHEDTTHAINVKTSNVITSNTSCIYLFRLVDQAGNECRYVVFYDKTEPRFLTSPEPDEETHIINDTTRVVWGDYKAIKVLANSKDGKEFNFDPNSKVDNYQGYAADDSLYPEIELTLRYMNNSNLFNSLKVEKIENDYYILIPITNVKINDSQYGYDLNLEDAKDFYFFPVDPVVTDEVGSRSITLPEFDSTGKVVYESTDEHKVKTNTYTVTNVTYTQIRDYNNNPTNRYITVTYTDDGKSYTIRGSIGEGRYIYSVYDGLNNKTSGLLWMNLDKTQTMGYGLFDYSENINFAIPLSGNIGTYSASRLFITSLNSTEDGAIPDYEVTYLHYAYDSSLYTDYIITAARVETGTPATETENPKNMFLILNMQNKTDASITKEIKITIYDEDGNDDYPKVSYPYSLEGAVRLGDANGAKDVYSEGFNYQSGKTDRKFSLPVNTVTDTEKQKNVTEEGLYVIKRVYTDNVTEEQLGTDRKIIYRAIYIDRNGIIEISNSNIASQIYNIGSDIGFTLGANYTDESYKKEIEATTIQNRQTANASSNTSNADFTSSDLFKTNKIQVQFRLSYDKHSFESNIKALQANTNDILAEMEDDDTKTTLQTSLNNFIYNSRFFRDTYKIDLMLKLKENDIIIDEKNEIVPTTNTFLKGTASYQTQNPAAVNTEMMTVRNNAFNLFYDPGNQNQYTVNINDQAGYVKYNDDNTINDANYLPNNLKITFNISHTAPEGDFYGKYYGRHDYDENVDDNGVHLNQPSLPLEQQTDDDGNSYYIYQLLSKYWAEGQLEPLSETKKSDIPTINGQQVRLKSTNNETLVFMFAITNDEYKAKIDPDNIKVYKGAINEQNLIFNRVDGSNIDCQVGNIRISQQRQVKSFISNVIDGVTYYAIIIFDNNLDEILDENERVLYGDYRLLNADQNNDKEDYFIRLQYVGNEDDYKGESYTDGAIQQSSFFSTTYTLTVDRIKPMYNLTKLMSIDKYVYNNVNTLPTAANYESVLDLYKPFYNFYTDEAQDFERSNLENYFFAIDYRPDSSFVFESISELDNNNSIYIRSIDKDNYKFSITPDDYKAYYDAVYLQGHPQFTPNNAKNITTNDIRTGYSLEDKKDLYHRVQFSLEDNDNSSLSANFLVSNNILRPDNYYEIIESDEAGNYRVYAIYVPETENSQFIFTYKLNSNESSRQTITYVSNINTPAYVEANGMDLQFLTISQKDRFLRALVNITTDTIKYEIDIRLDIDPADPNIKTIKVINRTTGETLKEYSVSTLNDGAYANTEEFIEAINYTLTYYDDLINDKSSRIYSQYGYNVNIQLVDRIGIAVRGFKELSNYEIEYAVAGAMLSPIFVDGNSSFIMQLEGQKGSTYLTSIKAYKYSNGWNEINNDNSSPGKEFNRTIEALKQPINYQFNKGVYKFIFTDNFNRTNQFFHEFGISSTQAGGSLSFGGNTSTLSDGYTYCGSDIEYTFDSSVYKVLIKFDGKIDYNGEFIEISDVVYNSASSFDRDQLALYGIAIITTENTTLIRFSGVIDSTTNKNTNLSKYHIKTILSSTADNYKWGDEERNSDIFVYDKMIAKYTAIQTINIRNLSGTSLLKEDDNEHLNLTEDFELVTTWRSSVDANERLAFNSRIVLNRTYYENGYLRTSTTNVNSGTIITQPGDYTAYVINDLGTTSGTISFSRGEGEITMYAVYAVNSTNSTERKLSSSSHISTYEDKILFSYFITSDYFNYRDTNLDTTIDYSSFDLSTYESNPDLASIFVTNTLASKYIDVRVNSNLNIRTIVHSVGVIEDNSNYPFVIYQVYSTTNTEENYIYRYIRIVFVDENNRDLSDVSVKNTDEGYDATNLAEDTSIITSNSSSIRVEFSFNGKVPVGDTIFVDRYYNGSLVETTTVNIADFEDIENFSLLISTVGLHEFVIRDLAGRTHLFNDSDKLSIYLVNQILFTTNGENPINNQIFNDNVDIQIIFNLSNQQLYVPKSLQVTVTKNGVDTNINSEDGQIFLSEPGYYTIRMVANTSNNAVQITSVYNLIIIDPNIATRNFSISNGTGFEIEKIVKVVGGEQMDITDTYSTNEQDLLLWLAHTDMVNNVDIGQGNSIFDVTLRYYEAITNSDRTFTFRIWINEETPVILSNIPDGTSTKKTITIDYNPSLIYSQIGKGYITLNDNVVETIDENSQDLVNTITICKTGTYWLRIYTADNTLISSYKYVKAEPLSSIAKIIIVVVVILVVLVIGIFFFLRRKGKYR